MKALVKILSASMLVAGCSTSAEKPDANYAMFIEAQKAIALNKQQQPLVRIKAQPGMQIRMEGVDEFVVYAPEVNEGQHGKVVQQYVAPRNDAAEVAMKALGVIGTVGGIWAVGNATSDLATAVGAAANHGYQFIQAPQPNMTIGGNGVIGSGTYNVETTTTTLSGTGAIGGAYTDSHNITTTTDNSWTDNSYTPVP